MLDILFIARRDFANLGYTLSQCMNELGLKTHMAMTIGTPKKYQEQGEIVRKEKRMKKLVESAKIIQFMHSHHVYTPLSLTIGDFNLKNKKVVVFHGGSLYRKRFIELNGLFNPIVDVSICQTADLLGLGAKNEKWVLPPVDTKKIQPKFGIGKVYKLAHYPSKMETKGSDMINKTMKVLLRDERFKKKFSYSFSSRNVLWEQNLKRIANCDIYIEQVKPLLRNRPFCEWSITALEAAALGKIVISHFKNSERYKKEYGKHTIQIANNRKQLINTVKGLIKKDKESLEELQVKTREWVEEKHSFDAIGKKLLEEVYKPLL